jgi:hypothetical protein
MSVATGKGLAMISPDEVKPNTLPPPVRIQEVLGDGQTLELPTSASWIGADSVLETSGGQPRALTIPLGGRQFAS